MKNIKVWLGVLSMCVVMMIPMTGNASEQVSELKTMEGVKEKQLQSENVMKIYVDSVGNYVFHNIPVQEKNARTKVVYVDETKEVREKVLADAGMRNQTKYVYDIENNPVYIGTWGGIATYARHTLGARIPSGGLNYLISTGDATWYNRSKNVALPYRNGNSTVPEHANQVDVAKGTAFVVINPDTNKNVIVTVNDFGPQQNTELGKKTIVDLDSGSFETLFGSTGIGRHVCQTNVTVNQYF